MLGGEGYEVALLPGLRPLLSSDERLSYCTSHRNRNMARLVH